MTFQEMEKAMEFVLRQQDQFVVDIQKLTESQTQLTEATLAITGMIGRIAEGQIKLTEAQARLTEAQTSMETKLAELAARLDAFISVVEKHIAEGRNGKGKA